MSVEFREGGLKKVILNFLIFLISFIFIWLGAGLIVTSTKRIAQRLKISSFAFSFFVLGLLTSLPEFSVGLNAVSQNKPEIFIGTLLGGMVVIFLFIIPVLAIFGNGIKLKHGFKPRNIIMAMFVIAAPAVIMLDQKATRIEGIILIALYGFLLFLIQRTKGILDLSNHKLFKFKSYSLLDMVKIIAGIIIVFVSSKTVVRETLYFSQIFSVAPVILSLLVLSIGTNIPELSLAIRAVLSGNKEIAFGDYIGSAAANTLLFGLFTIISSKEVYVVDNFIYPFLFTGLGLILFYFYARSEKELSRNEGASLLLFYLAFLFFKLIS